MFESKNSSPELRIQALEKSSQILTLGSVSKPEAKLDMPMYDLAKIIYKRNNEPYTPFQPNQVRYPFSNDNFTGRGFKETLPRTLTGEYQVAKNRVALLIGESGLAANLRYIPEDTVILPDINRDMVKFMEIYISSLRTSDNKEQWIRILRDNGPENTIDNLRYQLAHWDMAEETHPAMDNNAFYEAQKLALGKVIIPWHADILDQKSMYWLADQLVKRQSSVTFMNLTNLLPCLEQSNFHKAYQNLKTLPITSEAPILATGASIYIRPRSFEEEDVQLVAGRMNHEVGPFFGLDNLYRAYKQDNHCELGAIEARDYIYSGSKRPFEQLLITTLANLLRS